MNNDTTVADVGVSIKDLEVPKLVDRTALVQVFLPVSAAILNMPPKLRKKYMERYNQMLLSLTKEITILEAAINVSADVVKINNQLCQIEDPEKRNKLREEVLDKLFEREASPPKKIRKNKTPKPKAPAE